MATDERISDAGQAYKAVQEMVVAGLRLQEQRLKYEHLKFESECRLKRFWGMAAVAALFALMIGVNIRELLSVMALPSRDFGTRVSLLVGEPDREMASRHVRELRQCADVLTKLLAARAGAASAVSVDERQKLREDCHRL